MAGGGKEANYWPGFVDALSNVVVVMVFVLVVFTIGLIHFSQNKAKEIVAQAALDQREGGQPDEKQVVVKQFVSELLASKIESLVHENERLRELVTLHKSKTPASVESSPAAAASKASSPNASAVAPAADQAAPTPSESSLAPNRCPNWQWWCARTWRCAKH
ncbi:MAG: hypothetical protein R3E87_13410 [Burkholderiaceae bacterium]